MCRASGRRHLISPFGLPVPLLHFSHQGHLLEQYGSQLVLTALFPPLGPRSHIPRTVGLKYGGHPRACLGAHRCWHHLPQPPRHPPVRKKGVHWCCQHVADEEEGCPFETSASSTSSESSLASGALDASPSPSLTFLSYFRRTERPSTTRSALMLNAAGIPETVVDEGSEKLALYIGTDAAGSCSPLPP